MLWLTETACETQIPKDLAKEHFLEAFCKKGAPQELRSPRVRRVRRVSRGGEEGSAQRAALQNLTPSCQPASCRVEASTQAPPGPGGHWRQKGL